jgi:hypothetical protein
MDPCRPGTSAAGGDGWRCRADPLHRARQALGVTTRRQGFGQGAFYVWAMPADPPKAMAQGTHGMDAMDATCQGVVEGDAHLFEYDPDDPGRFTR